MPTGSYWHCLQSIFSLHNETINIWSHLLSGILWIYSLFFVIPSLLTNESWLENVLFGYLYPVEAILVFTRSSLFHIFKCNFIRDNHFFLLLDLSGILMLLTGGNAMDHGLN
jgi:adiponectin receptor